MKSLHIYLSIFYLFSWAVIGATYSVNLMWINGKPERGPNLCAEKNEAEYRKKCLDPIIAWLKISEPQVSINVWYDSNFIDHESILTTKSDLKQFEKNLVFKDVRSLDLVKKYADIFGANVSLYFRADLLRVIAVDQLAKNSIVDYIIYSDFNIPALSEQELFTTETMQQLKEFGFVMAKNAVETDIFENAFFIVDPKNTRFNQATRAGLIDINIKRGQEFLRRGYSTTPINGLALCESTFPQILWMSYGAMFQYLLYLQRKAEILEKSIKEIAMADYTINPRPEILKQIYLPEKLGEPYRKTGWLWTKPSSGDSEYHITRKESFLSANEAQQIIAQDEKKRLSQDPSSFFSVDNTKFQGNWYQWRKDNVENTMGSKPIVYTVDKLTPIARSIPIPVKDVKKPKSSFYSSNKGKPKPGGC